MAPLLPTPTSERKRQQYTKLRQIGSGTFGVVYLVRDLHTGGMTIHRTHALCHALVTSDHTAFGRALAATLVMKEVSLRGLCVPATLDTSDKWCPRAHEPCRRVACRCPLLAAR